MKRIFTLILVLLALTLSGCATRLALGYGDGGHAEHRNSPPPHAPAHGYRQKYQDHDLVYDSKLGAYVVIGYDDYFYNDDLYFRYRNDGWQVNVGLNGDGWRHVESYQVPEKLRYSKGKSDNKGKGKKKDKDNGRY